MRDVEEFSYHTIHKIHQVMDSAIRHYTMVQNIIGKLKLDSSDSINSFVIIKVESIAKK